MVKIVPTSGGTCTRFKEKKNKISLCHYNHTHTHTHRGMLFGMTNRAGWNGTFFEKNIHIHTHNIDTHKHTGVDPNDNAHLWMFWDSFSIQDATLFGWWNESVPVKIESNVNQDQNPNNDILASAYVKHGEETLIAIATWTNGTNETVRLDLDWDAMGLDMTRGHVEAPGGLKSFNHNDTATSFEIDNRGGVELVVPAYKGWLLVVSMN